MIRRVSSTSPVDRVTAAAERVVRLRCKLDAAICDLQTATEQLAAGSPVAGSSPANGSRRGESSGRGRRSAGQRGGRRKAASGNRGGRRGGRGRKPANDEQQQPASVDQPQPPQAAKRKYTRRQKPAESTAMAATATASTPTATAKPRNPASPPVVSEAGRGVNAEQSEPP